MREVFGTNAIESMWSELLAIAHDGHVSRNGPKDDQDQNTNNQESLVENDDDADNSGWNACDVELWQESNRQSSSHNLGDSQHPDCKCSVTLALKRIDADDDDETNELPDEQANDLHSRRGASTTNKAGSYELINDPEGKEPPSCPSKACRKPSKSFYILWIVVDAVVFSISVDKFDLEETECAFGVACCSFLEVALSDCSVPGDKLHDLSWLDMNSFWRRLV